MSNFDYSQFLRFATNFEELRTRHERFLFSFMDEMKLRALARVKRETPVDTGELRRNWRTSSVRKRGNVIYFDLRNPTEYASYIEYGHRLRGFGWWEGYHMAEKTVNAINRELPKRLNRAFSMMVRDLIQ